MHPLRYGLVAVCLVAGAACGDGGSGRAEKSPGAPLVVTGSPAVVGSGTPLAWTAEGVLVARREDEGPSPVAQCPSPQRRFSVRLRPANGAERVVAKGAAVFEPFLAVPSPDGENVAVLGFCDEEFIGSVTVASSRGGRERALPLPRGVAWGTPFSLQTLAWLSPTELLTVRLSFGAGDSLVREAVVVDVTTMRERVVLQGDDLIAVRPLPEGRLLALSGTGGTARAEVVEPGGARREIGTAFDAVPAPDGARVAMWEEAEEGPVTVRLVPLGKGDPVEAVVEGSILGVRWSPGSDRLLVATEVSEAGETVERLHVVDAGGGVRELRLPGYDGSAVWSPDGTRVAYADRRGEAVAVAV